MAFTSRYFDAFEWAYLLYHVITVDPVNPWKMTCAKGNSVVRQYLMHERLSVRFASLVGLGLIALYVSWALAYAFLPEGVLRGKSGAAVLAGDAAAGSVLVEFIRIFALNLGAVTFFVALPNRLLHVNGYPLGYLPPMIWFAHYGALLGSNSFSIAMPERLIPSLAVFSRSGVYEIAAYCLVAASTHAIAISRSPRLFSLTSEPIIPRPSLLDGIDKRGIVLAVLILLASNLWEAYRILAVV